VNLAVGSDCVKISANWKSVEIYFNFFPGKMIFKMYVLSSLMASGIIGYTNTTLVVFKSIYWAI